MEFAGKTVLVTGAARGLGRALAEAFARAGSNVVGCDRDADALASLGEALDAFGVGHVEPVCDVSDGEAVQETVAEACAAFGGIDVLVNNAGVSHIVPFLEMPDALWDQTMAVNLRGTYLFCKAVLPDMIDHGWGRIVNMSSQSGKKGNSHYAAYCASKAGIIALTQSLALEFAETGVTVNAVCPGVVFTPLWEEMLPDYARKRGMDPGGVKDYLISRIPLKRLAEPEDVARAVLFLASDRAAYMTGQSLNVTGGALMY